MDTKRESDLSREHNYGASGSPWAEVEFCHFATSIMGIAAVIMMFSPEQPQMRLAWLQATKLPEMPGAAMSFNKLFSIFIRISV